MHEVSGKNASIFPLNARLIVYQPYVGPTGEKYTSFWFEYFCFLVENMKL